MIEPALRDKLIAVYASWVDRDDFGQQYAQAGSPGPDAGPSSVRQFLEELLQTSSGPNAQIERPAALDRPDSTFGQLLGSPLVTRAGPLGGSSHRLPITRCACSPSTGFWPRPPTIRIRSTTTCNLAWRCWCRARARAGS